MSCGRSCFAEIRTAVRSKQYVLFCRAVQEGDLYGAWIANRRKNRYHKGQRGERIMNQVKTGGLIRAARLKNGMTQLQLAEKLSVSDKAVSKWERGVSHI